MKKTFLEFADEVMVGIEKQAGEFSPKEKISHLSEYSDKYIEAYSASKTDFGKGCPGYEGQCGSCVNGVFIPCGQ